ncbi:MAG: DUF374 domain-containing protein [Alphaproteobacteria bacterium]|nr:DUF374 domain-containing protein [Alphaproteobacteria bacterium]
MNIGKRLLKHPRTITLFSHVLAGYIRLVFATSRKTYLIEETATPYLSGEKNAVFSFWHGRMMLLPAACPPLRKMHVLISLHRDGVLISQVIGHFGQATVAGSSSRGGETAVREMLRILETGDNVSITPDGPRGPNQTVTTGGVVTVAKLAQKPIIPVTFSAKKSIRLGSWDKFMVALPFGHIIFCAGAPIVLDKDADEMLLRTQVEQAMNILVDKADEAAK